MSFSKYENQSLNLKIVIFILALSLNLIWENLHSLLYMQYRGKIITEYILFKASIADALMITIIITIVNYFFSRYKLVFILLFGFITAVLIEWWALNTGRWVYMPTMPIIPIIKTGLTPTLQLGLLGVFSYLGGQLVFKIMK